MTPTPVVLLRSGRNPFELCLTIGLLLLATYSIVDGAPPSISLDRGLEHWQRLLWSTNALVGAALALIGIYWTPMLTGLRIERVGMIVMGMGASAYVVVICTVSTFHRSGFVVTMGLAIALGSFLRARQITKDVRAWLAANRVIRDAA